jgi:PAS domain S-box-containing protein
VSIKRDAMLVNHRHRLMLHVLLLTGLLGLVPLTRYVYVIDTCISAVMCAWQCWHRCGTVCVLLITAGLLLLQWQCAGVCVCTSLCIYFSAQWLYSSLLLLVHFACTTTTALLQVNLSAGIRDVVLKQVDLGTVNGKLFDGCMHEVTSLLESDSFVHFYTSPYFADLLALRLAAPTEENKTCGVISFDALVLDEDSMPPESPAIVPPLESVNSSTAIRLEGNSTTASASASANSTSNYGFGYTPVGTPSHVRGTVPDNDADQRLLKATPSIASMDSALAMAAKSDIWSSKNSEDAEAWLAKFTSSADSFPACIVVSDMTQHGAPMIFVNAAFCKVTGYTKEESVGRNCRFLQGPDTEPEAVATIRSTLSKGQDCHVKITNYRKNGEKFQNLLSMKPVFDAYGVYRYVIGVQFEVLADKSLKKRLTQLDALLHLMPTKLQSASARSMLKGKPDLMNLAGKQACDYICNT